MNEELKEWSWWSPDNDMYKAFVSTNEYIGGTYLSGLIERFTKQLNKVKERISTFYEQIGL